MFKKIDLLSYNGDLRTCFIRMFTQMTRLFHKVIVLQIIKAPGTRPADESKRTKRVE